MTLIDEFSVVLQQTKPHFINVDAEVCEQIAEDFAISFAKWFALHHTEEVFYEENYTKEMLDKFKKEKGL